ncbi:MAG: oligoendopeptidase F [Clostridiaceae bacterium]|nr:oligoendopeptidase F [Clostridiaceae bacterium]
MDTDTQPPRRSRGEIPEIYRWQLEDIFPDDQSWETALAAIPDLLEKIEHFRGHLGDDPATMLAALQQSDQIDLELMELYAYARMRRDEDNGVNRCQDMADRVTNLYYQAAAATAFLSPELAGLPEDRLLLWMNEHTSFQPYRQVLLNLIRTKPHILPEAEEALLSRFGPVTEGLGNAYTVFDNVDLKLGSISDGEGRTIELTPALFSQLREHHDHSVRQAAFARIHQAFADYGQTLATLYATRVKADLVFALARHHQDSLSAALFADNLPVSIYTSLIEAVHDGQPTLNRYLELRRKQLKLPDLHISDTYVPILDVPDRRYTYEQACSLVKQGLAPLGPEYLHVVEQHLNNRWIDVYETPGKTNGAYSWGSYKSHPYILMNYGSMLSDIFTLAHELGHSLHTYYTNRRPYPEAHYPIFLAEIASTVNEILLMRSLLGRCDESTPDGRQEKAYLLNHFLEEFRLTVFRQTMFAEFEWQVHQKAEQGESLTAEVLCSVYRDLLRRYFGPDVIIDDFMQWEWARIPHFYNAYYVFQYATGFSAAVTLVRQILTEGQPAVDRYLTFLGAGNSDYPLAVLAAAGVDLSSPAPVQDAMMEFNSSLDELARLIQED